MKCVGKLSNRLRGLISHRLTTQLTTSTSVEQGFNCTADWKYKSVKALVKILCPQSYSVTFLNWDFLLSMDFFYTFVDSGPSSSWWESIVYPIFQKGPPLFPQIIDLQDHLTVHLNHTSTHIPDQLLSYSGHHEELVALRHSLSCYKLSLYCHVFYHFMAISSRSAFRLCAAFMKVCLWEQKSVMGQETQTQHRLLSSYLSNVYTKI